MKFKEKHLLTLRDALHLLVAFSEGDANTIFGSSEEISYDHKGEWIKDSKEMLKDLNKHIIEINEV